MTFLWQQQCTCWCHVKSNIVIVSDKAPFCHESCVDSSLNNAGILVKLQFSRQCFVVYNLTWVYTLLQLCSLIECCQRWHLCATLTSSSAFISFFSLFITIHHHHNSLLYSFDFSSRFISFQLFAVPFVLRINPHASLPSVKKCIQFALNLWLTVIIIHLSF